MLKEVTIRYRIEASDEVQLFLGKLIDRELEKSVLKTFKKVLDKATAEELEARGVKTLPFPSVTFTENGNVLRVATDESSGRETGTEGEGSK